MLIRQMHQRDIFYYWYFLDKSFKYEIHHRLSFNDVAIASIKGKDYIIHFWYMGKDDPINIMENSNLNEKSRLL